MKSSLDHLPKGKQQELRRIVEILHEEFEDALGPATAEWKKRGRILKIILFGSYARGGWVDERNVGKGYRSDFDLLIVVNNKKLADFGTYWHKARDRLLRDRAIDTPVSFIVHSRRFVNDALRKGQYFFSDIRREGNVLYELDSEPLAEPKLLSSKDAYEAARENFEAYIPSGEEFYEIAKFARVRGWDKKAAFLVHQAVENLYRALLLTLTNYSPPSHNIAFLRSLAESRDRRLVEAWPRDAQRYRAWFNTLAEAYVKARYSRHYEISQEALAWLGERTERLHDIVEAVCREHLAKLARDAGID